MILDIDLVSDFVCRGAFSARCASTARSTAACGAPGSRSAGQLAAVLPVPDARFRANRIAPSSKRSSRRTADDEVLARVSKRRRPTTCISRRPHRDSTNTLNAHRLSYARSRSARRSSASARRRSAVRGAFPAGTGYRRRRHARRHRHCDGDNKDAVRAYLDSDADTATVKRMAAQVRNQGIAGCLFHHQPQARGVRAQSATALGAAILQALG